MFVQSALTFLLHVFAWQEYFLQYEKMTDGTTGLPLDNNSNYEHREDDLSQVEDLDAMEQALDKFMEELFATAGPSNVLIKKNFAIDKYSADEFKETLDKFGDLIHFEIIKQFAMVVAVFRKAEEAATAKSTLNDDNLFFGKVCSIRR